MKYFIDTEFLEGTQAKRFCGFEYGRIKPTIDLISIAIVCEDGREFYEISKEFNLHEAWNRFQIETRTYNHGYETETVNDKVYWLRNNVLLPIFYDLALQDFYATHDEDDEWLYQGTLVDFGVFQNMKHFSGDYKWFKKLLNKYGKTNQQIADAVKEFANNIYDFSRDIAKNGLESTTATNPPEFYGYFADYDWVVFCWMFGKMIDLPKGFPMYCRDLKQILDEEVAGLDWYCGRDIWSNTSSRGRELQEGDRPATFDEKLKAVKDAANYPTQANEHNALADAKWNLELYKFINKFLSPEEMIRSGRHVGNSTRQADMYIQEIFAHPNQFIRICDHARSDHNRADEHLFKIVARRLAMEHPGVGYQVNKDTKKIRIIFNAEKF